MNIGVDVDGVLVDMEGYQREYGKKYFEEKLGMKPINEKGFDIEDIYGCTHAEREKFWTKYIWGYCLRAPMSENAALVSKELREKGHKIYIITGRAHTTENGTSGKLFRWMLRHWLKKNRFEYDDIVYCSEKESSTDKLDACKRYDINLMIDDKPENLLSLKDEIKVICYPAIWNVDMNNDKVIRVKNWSEIREYIGGVDNSTE